MTAPPPLHGTPDVSCTMGACAFAAHDAREGDKRVIVLRSTGGDWTALPPSPVLNRSVNAWDPVSISCATATFCGVTGRLSAAVWDGSAWGHPLEVSTGSHDISCPTAGRCVALAGEDTNTYPSRQRIATWNQGRWTTVTVTGSLQAVSCSSAERCFALAAPRSGGQQPTHPIAGSWILSGTTWLPVGEPLPPLAEVAQVRFEGLSCASAGCMVFGRRSDRPPVAWHYRF